MNLKNSKFFKRIQELRRISKEKLRKQKELRARATDAVLANVFSEASGSILKTGHRSSRLKKLIKLQKRRFQARKLLQPEQESEDVNIAGNAVDSALTTNGLIQLNNVCFRINCELNNRNHSDDLPSISETKSSICVSHSRYSLIGKISKTLGFKLVKESKMWNILWTDSLPGVELYKNMKRFQQINHFPGMLEICRKDLLSRNLNRMLKLFPRDYKIFPKTWIFPADYGEALKYSSSHIKHKSRMFIIKPDAGAQGRGIWLTNDLKTINPTERMICQTYVNRPLLIDGYKFDLRIYALITSVDPLRIFVYNEGLARFATNKYVEPTSENSCDLFMHLTNYAVNRRSAQYDLQDNDDCGSKRTFSAINTWLHNRNYNVNDFWCNIDDTIIKTVLSAWPMLKHNYHACFPGHDKIQACFEILGIDVLVDGKLKPYILEVNHSPSFHTNELVDRQVKKALIRDTLKLVSCVLVDKQQILREDRKRIKARLLNMKQGDTSTNHASGSADIEAPQSAHDKGSTDEATHCPLGALAQQVAWEESHMGDFRRIMPPHESEKLSYYFQFYALQNQASIYAETAASKKREEGARKLRIELEAKRLRQQELINNRGHFRFEDQRRKRATLPRSVLERQMKYKYRSQAQWMPGFISDAEERLRRSWMQMRTELLSNMQIVQCVFLALYTGGDLTNADISNYPDLFSRLECGEDIIADART